MEKEVGSNLFLGKILTSDSEDEVIDVCSILSPNVSSQNFEVTSAESRDHA